MNKISTKNYFTNITIALAVVIFFISDRYLKLEALNGSTLPLIGNIFDFYFVANYYMAFSLPLNGIILNTIVCVLIIALSVHASHLRLKKNYSLTEITLILFIIAGAISNLFDRLMYGYVVDYLNLQYFTIFNLADIVISSAAIFLIFYNLKKK